MPRVIDTTSGTGAEPFRAPFAGYRTAIVSVAFVRGDEEIVEGHKAEAYGAFRGSLQRNGYDVSDAQFCVALDSGDDPTANVELRLNVSRDVEEEAAGAE